MFYDESGVLLRERAGVGWEQGGSAFRTGKGIPRKHERERAEMGSARPGTEGEGVFAIVIFIFILHMSILFRGCLLHPVPAILVSGVRRAS